MNADVDFDETRATEINVIGWVFTGIAIAVVFLKIFTRVNVVKKPGWDDFFIFFSLALSIIATALVSRSVTLGLGRHTAAVVAEHGMERTIATARWQIIAFPFNIGAFSFPNISISILVSKLLNPNTLRTRFLYGLSIMQVVFAIISVLVVFLQCSPTQKLWNTSLSGSCWDPAVFNDYSYWVSAYTTVTDIVLAVMPISVFWNLQMPFSKKLSVCVMMGLTLLSAIVTIVKATYLHLFTDKTDPLWNVVPLVNWGLVEQNVVIIAACISSLRPFFRRTFKSKNPSTGGTSNSHSRSGFIAQHIAGKRPPSVSEFPLHERQQAGDDVESDEGQQDSRQGSQQGIWRTRVVKVERDEDHRRNSTSLSRRSVTPWEM